MISSSSATSGPSSNNSEATPRWNESLGQAAEIAGDLATEGNGKEILQAKSDGPLCDEPIKNPAPMGPTLDPICDMEVDQTTALLVERDGKTFYFCSDHCRQAFLKTIAGVKSDSKSGSCCGESSTP